MKTIDMIAGAAATHAIAFVLGTMFGMWLIVITNCYLRSQCQ